MLYNTLCMYYSAHNGIQLTRDMRDWSRKGPGCTMSFMVMSSSLVPPPVSISTEGLMVTGGTARLVMIRFSGRPGRSSSSHASSLMAENSASTRMGFRSSPAYKNDTSLLQDCKSNQTAVHVHLHDCLADASQGTTQGVTLYIPERLRSTFQRTSHRVPTGAWSEFLDMSILTVIAGHCLRKVLDEHLVEQAADLVIVQDGLLELSLVLLPLAKRLSILVMHSLQRSSHLPAT